MGHDGFQFGVGGVGQPLYLVLRMVEEPVKFPAGVQV
jgi:hypothetical protein